MSTDQPTCERCSQPIADGAYIDVACKTWLHKVLAATAAVAGEAAVTIAKLDRVDPVGGEIEDDPEPEGRQPSALYPTPSIVDYDAAEQHQAAVGELLGWARHIAEERGVPMPTARRRTLACTHQTCWAARARTARIGRYDASALQGPECLPPPPREQHPVEVLARWLQGHLEWLRRRPEAAEAWGAIGDAAMAVQRVVDRHPDRGYAGICGAKTMEGTCGEPLRPVAEARTHRCRCGAVHDLAQRREAMLAASDEAWRTAAEAAHALRSLGVAANANSIRSWARDGRLGPHPESLHGQPLYRLGSVRELVAQAQEQARMRKLQRAIREAQAAERKRQRSDQAV